MPAGNIVYNSSSSTPPIIKKETPEPIYATVKKSNKVTPPKKGITRRGGPGRGPLKRKPTKKNSIRSSNTVYAVINWRNSSKKPTKNTRKRISRTPLKRMGSNGKLILANNNSSPSNRENVGRVLRNVKNANPLSKIEAQKKLNRAMESK